MQQHCHHSLYMRAFADALHEHLACCEVATAHLHTSLVCNTLIDQAPCMNCKSCFMCDLLNDIQHEGVWRNGSASDSRSEGWEFESLCPHCCRSGTCSLVALLAPCIGACVFSRVWLQQIDAAGRQVRYTEQNCEVKKQRA